MTREVLTLAGQIIGAYLGAQFGPVGQAVGAAIGGYAGAYIGNKIDPLEGPNIGDRHVQVATYGQPIPLLFGTVRTAGIIIWAADLEEGDAGGKGGPVEGQVFNATFAVLLSRNRLRGIRRAWANGVLVYSDIIQEDKPISDEVGITFYGGTEDQLPDATMESYLGAGNVPGYRGYGYVVINGMSLEKFGNRIPNMEFEVVAEQEWLGGDPISLVGDTIGGSDDTDFNWVKILYRQDHQMVLIGGTPTGPLTLRGYNPMTGVYTDAVELDITVDQFSDMVYAPEFEALFLLVTFGVDTYLRRYDAVYFTMLKEVKTSGANIPYMFPAGTPGGYLAYDPTYMAINIIYKSQFVALGLHRYDILTDKLGKRLFNEGPFSFGTGIAVGGRQVHISLTVAGFQAMDITPGLWNGSTWDRRSLANEVYLDIEQYKGDGDNPPETEWHLYEATVATTPRAAYDTVRNHYVVIAVDGRLWTVTDEIDPVTTLETDLLVGGGTFTGGDFDVMYMSGIDAIVVVTNTGRVWAVDAETFELQLTDYVLPDASGGMPAIRQSVLDPGAIIVAGAPGLDGEWRLYEQPLYSEQVGTAVSKICVAAGYEEADVESSELTQRLRGYRIVQPGPVRPALEQLAAVFKFTGAEADDQLLFKLRGVASSATYTSDDCVIENDAERPVQQSRAQETTLPRRFALTAPDIATDYQPLTQRAERQAVEAGEDVSMSTDIVLFPDESKQAADWMIFDAWMARDTAALKLTAAALRLVGGDVITINSRRMRVVGKTLEAMAVQLSLAADDDSLIVQYGTGANSEHTPQVPSPTATLNFSLLRTPLLRDQDDDYGLYWATWAISGTFTSATVFANKPSDPGRWSNTGSKVNSPGASVGYTTDALGDWDGLNCFDESTTVNVTFVNVIPAAATRASVLAGANFALIGRELVHFRDVTAEADGTYTLGGFLRARKGTEAYAVDHDEGDLVVLLSEATIGSFDTGAGDQGTTIRYSPQPAGQAFNGGLPNESTSLSAYRLVPLSPVDVRGERDTSDNLTITWKRRSRKTRSFVGAPGIYVPLGESSETYVVQIMDGTDLVRTINVTGDPECEYSAANQTSDFGAPQAAISVRVAQTAERVPAPLRWNYREATI